MDALAHSPWLLVPGAQCVNLVLSFWGALGLAVWAARYAPSPDLQKWLLCVPLLKLMHDLAHGVPMGNYVRSEFAGTRWELGNVALGARWSSWQGVPSFDFRFGVLRDGDWYGLSGGDGLVHILVGRGFTWLVLGGLVVIASIAGVRVVRRLAAWRAFARAWTCSDDQDGGPTRVGRVCVRRVLTPEQGAFTSGLLHPVIWLPRVGALGAAEVSAVLRHELAHVRRGDAWLFALVGLATDLLWFVPGVRHLERRVHDAAELAADAAAVRHGADPLALANALVHTAHARSPASSGAGANFGSSVAGRVRRLLEPAPRHGRAHTALRTVASCLLAWIAVHSLFFGYR